MNNFLKKYWWIPTIIAFLIGLCIAIKAAMIHWEENYPYRIYRANIELQYHGARADLVECIDSVIRSVAPTTCMNGLQILSMCEEYNIDLFFVLAQGTKESHFGTKGLAARTNSVFNVFAYDGLKYHEIDKRGKYSHPDLSIEPYMKLLRKRYLVNGKTEMDMMVKFVDVKGKRYASAPDYENALTNIYKGYIDDPVLSEKYAIYTKYRILAGI